MYRETTEEMLAEYNAKANGGGGSDLMSQAFVLMGTFGGLFLFVMLISGGDMSPRMMGKLIGLGFMAVVVFFIAMVQAALS